MLEIQKYLRGGKTVADLEKEFGIYNYAHPNLPLVGFKYGLIQSDKIKFHPIVRECRGIVLERNSWDVVAFPFKRFFNLGEDKECEACFDWNNFTCQEKLDGSLMIVYYYAGEWHVNTSGSFGYGVCYDSGCSWRELFWNTSGINKDNLNKHTIYIFELWTKYNKVVRSYKEAFVKLIGLRCNISQEEYGNFILDTESDYIGVKRPEIFVFNNIDEVITQLKIYEESDPTFEGFVLCDGNFNRIKIKSESYLRAHRQKGNGQFIYRNIIPDLLKGHLKLLSEFYPEWLEELEECNKEINDLVRNTKIIWNTIKDIASRKEFAILAKNMEGSHIPAVLFWMRDGKYDSIEQAFLANEDYLVKYFEGKK